MDIHDELKAAIARAEATEKVAFQAQEMAKEQCARAEAAEAEVRQIKETLTDPLRVHANMLRGSIAKLSYEQIAHLHPEIERQRDEAWTAGAEAMREACAKQIEDWTTLDLWKSDGAAAIRRIPIPAQEVK